MSRRHHMQNTDKNEKEIVKTLREIAGVTVQTGVNDILVGYKGNNYWFEVKNPNVANKQGVVSPSSISEGQKYLVKNWKGHYRIVTTLDEILDEIGL